MRVAVFGDIHGNLRALEAVLADARAHDIDHYIFLGDLIYNGLDPQLCFDRLMQIQPLITIKGNSDWYIEQIPTFTPRTAEEKQLLKFYKYTSIRMGKQSREKVATFSSAERVELGGVSFLACHGSPYDDTEGLYADRPFAPLLSKKLSLEQVDVVLSAHTHIPADFHREGLRFINPGAVGYSFDKDTRASWAMLTLNEGVMNVKFRKVEYDIKRYAEEVAHALQSFPLFAGLLHALQNATQSA